MHYVQPSINIIQQTVYTQVVKQIFFCNFIISFLKKVKLNNYKENLIYMAESLYMLQILFSLHYNESIKIACLI